MGSRSPKPSSSMSTSADRRKERRRRDHERSDAGTSRRRSRERDRDRSRERDRDRDRDRDSERRRKKSTDSKGKGKERPLLDGIVSGLNIKDEEVTKSKAKAKAKANTTFEMGEDFIAFVEDEGEDRAYVREWDREKVKSRTSDGGRERYRQGSAQKRKYDLVFDEDDLVDSHERPSKVISPKTPWVSAVNWEDCSNVAEMLHREVEAFVDYIRPTPVEDEIRGLVVDLVSKAVTNAFPDAKVIPFGSFGTKLYLPLGDIDLVVQSQSMAYSDKVTVLHAIANTLKRAKITPKVTIIAKAKVPIVKFVTTHCRLNVDISINQVNGVIASQVVNGFLKDMHGGGNALRSLVMITKAFLNQRSMNEVYSGGLGSYSIVCLAVSFLQMHPKIRRGEIDAEKNLGVLMIEFFELYGCYFNYEEVGISIRDGGYYFSKKDRGWWDYHRSNLLSIEDPIDPSNDISKGSYGIQKVRTTFAGAHGILTAAAYYNAGIIKSHQNGESFSLRGGRKSDDTSILARILSVTQEAINHRKLIQEVYDERTLHRLLGVEPKPVVPAVDTRRKPGSSGRGSKQPSIHKTDEISEEVDMEMESEDDEYQRRQQSDDESRYGITTRNQQPRKRRKLSTSQDVHTFFTTDDDDDDDENGLIINTVAGNKGHGRNSEDISGGDAEGQKSRTVRSYWLSKGAGRGEVHDDSS